MEFCAICGRPADCTHHLIFGFSSRKLADADGLVIPICNDCHNMGCDSIHNNIAAEGLSKMLGQALWERDYVIRGACSVSEDFGEYLEDEARAKFRERYGKSWL